MPLTLNQRYEYASALKSVQPRITVAIEFAPGDTVYFTSHDSSQRPSGGGVVAVDGCIESFKGATQKINTRSFHSSIGDISFKLADIGGQVSAIFQQKETEGKSPRRRKVTVYFGYGPHLVPNDAAYSLENLDWIDYQLQFTMIFDYYTWGATGYECHASDVQRLKTVDIFIPDKSTLRESIDDEQLFIPISEVVSSPKFQTIDHDNSYTHLPSTTGVGYVLIEDEVIAHSGIVNDATYGVSLAVLERGALNTRAAPHEIDESASQDRRTSVQEFIFIEGPALKLLYAVLTGVSYGDSAPWPDHWHLGIDTALVRLSDFESANPALWETSSNTGKKLRFQNLEKENGESFIRDEILAWVGGFMPVYSTGEVGFKELVPVISNSGYIAELNDANITRISDIKHALDDVVNDITIAWDWSWQKEIFKQNSRVLDSTSIAKHKEAKPKRFEFHGVVSSNSSEQQLFNIFDSLRNRYAGGGFSCAVEVLPEVNYLEVGDIVRVKTDSMPDPLAGGTLDRVFEVQQISPNTRTGAVRLALFASTDLAGEFRQITANNVLNDDWYTADPPGAFSAATDLDSLPQVSGGAITSNLTLSGGGRMGDGVFYHAGDLTLNTGVTLTITGNVFLKIRGNFTINGTIDGEGGGMAGGAGGTLFTASGTTSRSWAGSSFFTGNVYAYNSGILETNEGTGLEAGPWRGVGTTRGANFTYPITTNPGGYRHFPPATTGWRQTIAPLPMTNRDGVLGVPDGVDPLQNSIYFLDIRGIGGRGGKPRVMAASSTSATIAADGPDGGAGGAGLIVVCRGETRGAGSDINLSGAQGDTAPFFEVASGEGVSWSSGASGHPGGFYLLIDGNHTFDSDVENITQDFPVNALAGTTIDDSAYTGEFAASYWDADSVSTWPANVGDSSSTFTDFGEAGFKIQYIPTAEGVDGEEETPLSPLPAVTGLTLTSGNATLSRAADGSIREQIRAEWTPHNKAWCGGYELQMKETAQADSEFRTVVLIDNPATYYGLIDVTELIDYTVRIRTLPASTAINTASPWASDIHTPVGKSATPTTPSGLSITVQDNGTTLVELDEHPDADFLEFVIREGAAWPGGTRIARGPQNEFQLDNLPAGTHDLYIVALDRSGNISASINDSVTITGPSAPSAAVTFENGNFRLAVTAGGGSYRAASFRLEYSSAEVATFAGLSYARVVDWTGPRTFDLIQIDAAGNESPAASVLVSPTLPGTPTVSATGFLQTVTLDYAATAGSLPIERFLLYRGPVFGTAATIPDKAGTSKFTIISEPQAGTYIYWVVARDTAGNLSSPGSASATTTQGDFVLYNNFQSGPTFGGTITNGLVDNNALFLLVDEDQTWDLNDNPYATNQDRINAALVAYLPPTTTASYVEVFDAGVVIPSTQITATVTSSARQGSPSVSFTVAYSEDNVTWSSESAGSVFATDVRYVRITINATGSGDDIAQINSAAVQLSIQEQTESGTVVCSSGDSGGTAITFQKNWLDVSSITATVYGTSSHKAVVNFTDVPNPSPPSFLIFNDSGTRQNGTVSYIIRGVVE